MFISPPTKASPSLLRQPAGFLALGFGSGLSPWMPGTAGSLAALPLAYWLKMLPLWLYFVVLAVTVLIGFWACDVTGKRLGVHDHGAIVWDEFCGLWLTVALVPNQWPWLVLGFFLFRAFDIAKVWPASWFDRKVHNGIGVMLDDLAAGLWGMLVLQAMVWWMVNQRLAALA
ncbi:MAG: phosphatidylglycerophosphatase A [Wenzhouxiangellaceae bacterium]